MSDIALQVLVGTALTDTKFCEGLLNGLRPRLVADFDLTDDERRAVLAIRATCIQEFAAHLCEWLEASPHSQLLAATPAAQPLPSPLFGTRLPSDHFGSLAARTAGALAG
jgi:hypothetical protein